MQVKPAPRAAAFAIFDQSMKAINMNQTITRRASQIIALTSVLLLGACATAPQPIAALEQANSSYQRAAADPQVVRSAPVELRKAQQALQQAQAAASSGKDLASVEHFARLASQRTEVAVQTGALASAEKAVADAAMQRDRIVIESRTQEADSQRAMAEKARMQAESQRNQAEAARKLAEERLAAVQASQAQTAAESARAKSLEDQLADLKAKQTSRGMVLTLGDVLFDTGRAELKPGAERSLDQLVTFMTQNPERNVAVEGYTDSMGSDGSNQILSERRSNAVKNALIVRGIAPNRVSATGYGEARPVASNDNAAGRQQNRRVEIVISGT